MNTKMQTTEYTDHTEARTGKEINRSAQPLLSFFPSVCSVFSVVLTLAFAVAAQAQLPSTSPIKAGFDPARLEVAHATMKRFVEENQHAGLITLLAHDGKIADVQTYGYRDLEKKLPMTRDTICRIYSTSAPTCGAGRA